MGTWSTAKYVHPTTCITPLSYANLMIHESLPVTVSPLHTLFCSGVETSSKDATSRSYSGAVSARSRRLRRWAGIDEALSAKSLSLQVLSALPKLCLSDANLRDWKECVRTMVMTKGRRRIVTSSLVNIIRVLLMEMRLSFSALEAAVEVRCFHYGLAVCCPAVAHVFTLLTCQVGLHTHCVAPGH